MRKRGFTLAEVLITLGIVGVVAGLSAPSLVSSTQDRATGARLAATVSQLETAFHNAISTEGVENLYQTRMWDEAPIRAGMAGEITRFVGNLGRYLAITNYSTGFDTAPYRQAGIRIYDMSANGGRGNEYIGQDGANIPFPSGGEDWGFPIFMKNGSLVSFSTFNGRTPTENEITTIAGRGGSLYSNAADVFIDANGLEGPNIMGRDIFCFYLGENGNLYPAGGSDVDALDQDGGGLWSGDGYWACTDNVKANHGLGCTGRLVEHGYKIDY